MVTRSLHGFYCWTGRQYVTFWRIGLFAALMGELGVGKTMLLNVLTQRVYTGVVTGDRFVNRQALPADFQSQSWVLVIVFVILRILNERISEVTAIKWILMYRLLLSAKLSCFRLNSINQNPFLWLRKRHNESFVSNNVVPRPNVVQCREVSKDGLRSTQTLLLDLLASSTGSEPLLLLNLPRRSVSSQCLPRASTDAYHV